MRSNNSRYAVFLLTVVAAVFVVRCRQGSGKNAGDTTSSAVRIDPRSVLKYARGFRIDYYDRYRDVSILHLRGGKADTLHYLLVDQGVAPPADRPGIPVITTPVKSFAVESSVHVALADLAGAADRITGLGDLHYVNSPIVREGIRTGKVKQIGIENTINSELVISMRPGVLIAMSDPDAAFGQYKTIVDAGIPVLPDAEWLETTPLGRAEWAKLIGALVDKEDSVAEKFAHIEHAYLQLASIGTRVSVKPSVILNIPFKGVWYMPAGDNYMTQFLRDAGASYQWMAAKGTTSIPLNFETVAPIALKADYWLNVGIVDSKKDLLAKDSRFIAFRPFQKDAIYNYDNRVNDLGSNDYWESGIVNPQLVLADLIRILHPGLLPQDRLYYYKQLK